MFIARSEYGDELWLFQVSAYPEESLGHFLGRFRRLNHLKSSDLSAILGLRYRTVSYWETPSRRRIPAPKDLEALSRLTGVDAAQLRLMLSPDDALFLRTRLCALCYAEAPFHKVTWQDTRISKCDRHQCELLCECPRCGSDFQLPSYWADGQCDRCYLPFTEMNPLE
jgi:transcriptional regulator with XRE-family HTH domain